MYKVYISRIAVMEGEAEEGRERSKWMGSFTKAKAVAIDLN